MIKLWNKSSNLSGSCSLFVALALPIFLAIFQGKQIQHFEKSFKRNFTISKRFFNNLVIRVYHVQISTIVKRKETTNFEAKENKFYKVFPDVIDVDVCGTKITGDNFTTELYGTKTRTYYTVPNTILNFLSFHLKLQKLVNAVRRYSLYKFGWF